MNNHQWILFVVILFWVILALFVVFLFCMAISWGLAVSKVLIILSEIIDEVKIDSIQADSILIDYIEGKDSTVFFKDVRE